MENKKPVMDMQVQRILQNKMPIAGGTAWFQPALGVARLFSGTFPWGHVGFHTLPSRSLSPPAELLDKPVRRERL